MTEGKPLGKGLCIRETCFFGKREEKEKEMTAVNIGAFSFGTLGLILLAVYTLYNLASLLGFTEKHEQEYAREGASDFLESIAVLFFVALGVSAFIIIPLIL